MGSREPSVDPENTTQKLYTHTRLGVAQGAEGLAMQGHLNPDSQHLRGHGDTTPITPTL